MKDDTISRKAAIDAINHICPVDTEYDCTLLDRVDVRCVLSDLLSAQPEIIRCRDCRYWEREKPFATSGRCFIWECANRKGSDYCSEARKVSE